MASADSGHVGPKASPFDLRRGLFLWQSPRRSQTNSQERQQSQDAGGADVGVDGAPNGIDCRPTSPVTVTWPTRSGCLRTARGSVLKSATAGAVRCWQVSWSVRPVAGKCAPIIGATQTSFMYVHPDTSGDRTAPDLAVGDRRVHGSANSSGLGARCLGLEPEDDPKRPEGANSFTAIGGSVWIVRLMKPSATSGSTDAVEPENHLVACTLERGWEEAL